MSRSRRTPRTRLRENIFVRPLLFVAGGLVLSAIALSLDAAVGQEAVPLALRMPPSSARLLLGTLAGASLTLAGITFWVRAAAVQLAASQYSPRVVYGFLQDWFQQSMMGLLVGLFAYVVVVFSAVPDPIEQPGRMPYLSVLIAALLAGGSVLALLWAIQNSSRLMQAGELARRITEITLKRIREAHPPLGARPAARGVATFSPAHHGVIIRAHTAGWVQRIDEQALLDALPEDATVRLEVRVGLFVSPNRPLCTVWSESGLVLGAGDRVRRAIRLAGSRLVSVDVDYGIQQLVDVALGSLSRGTADTAGAQEAILHIEQVLRELLLRDLPPVSSIDEIGRHVLRPREFTFEDYVRDALDRVRMIAADYPTVAMTLLTSIGELASELERAERPERAEPLRRQGALALAACEAAELLSDDLDRIREIAARHQLAT